MVKLFIGSGVALVTPFTADGSAVNFEALGNLIDFHLDNKTDAIIINATTGEGTTMTNSEKEEVIKFTLDRIKGKIPVIASTGGNNTNVVIENSKRAEELGVDGLLVITPYYNKTTQKGLVAHFKAVAESVELPIIMYNVPSRTGLNMLPSTVAELAKIPNIVGTKEASGDISQVAKIVELTQGENFDIYSGEDGLLFPILALGGMGVISTSANVLPKEFHDICEKWFSGDVNGSRDLQLKVIAMVEAMFCEVNPIPVKTALNLMGKNVGPLRLPLVDPAPENFEKIKASLKKWNLV